MELVGKGDMVTDLNRKALDIAFGTFTTLYFILYILPLLHVDIHHIFIIQKFNRNLSEFSIPLTSLWWLGIFVIQHCTEVMILRMMS